jgi:hypothetical protein
LEFESENISSPEAYRQEESKDGGSYGRDESLSCAPQNLFCPLSSLFVRQASKEILLVLV